MQQKFASYYTQESDAIVLELYVPYRVEFLTDLFAFLHDQLTSPEHGLLFHGFSLYEVKGAFRSEVPEAEPYQELTLVIRLVFDVEQYQEAVAEPPTSFVKGTLDDRLQGIAEQMVGITKLSEEQIWIVRFEAGKTQLIRLIGKEG